MADKLEHYRDNLRHVIRPDKPREREESPKAGLADFEALYLAHLLRDYAAYDAPGHHRGIAWAYVEYIDMVVRDEGRSTVVVYAQTHDAFEVLDQALMVAHGEETQIQRTIRETIDTMREDVMAL